MPSGVVCKTELTNWKVFICWPPVPELAAMISPLFAAVALLIPKAK